MPFASIGPGLKSEVAANTKLIMQFHDNQMMLKSNKTRWLQWHPMHTSRQTGDNDGRSQPQAISIHFSNAVKRRAMALALRS